MSNKIHPYSCARCGKKITAHQYIRNTKNFIILSKIEVLHFCNKCIRESNGDK